MSLAEQAIQTLSKGVELHYEGTHATHVAKHAPKFFRDALISLCLTLQRDRQNNIRRPGYQLNTTYSEIFGGSTCIFGWCAVYAFDGVKKSYDDLHASAVIQVCDKQRLLYSIQMKVPRDPVAFFGEEWSKIERLAPKPSLVLDGGELMTMPGVSTMCNCCHTEPKNVKLKKCGRCGKAYYCGETCQKRDWKRHKKVCDVYALNL